MVLIDYLNVNSLESSISVSMQTTRVHCYKNYYSSVCILFNTLLNSTKTSYN